MGGNAWSKMDLGNWQGDSWSTVRTFYHSTSPFLLSFLPQMCSMDEHLCFQVVGTLDFKRQGGALRSNDTLEGWLDTGHRTNCPLLCPQAEATYISDLQKQIRVQRTSLFQAGCETDKMESLTWNLSTKMRCNQISWKRVTKPKLYKIDNMFKIPSAEFTPKETKLIEQAEF